MPYIIAFIFGLLASFGALLIELFFLSWTIDTSSQMNLAETAFTPTFFSLLILALIEESTKIVFFLRSSRFRELPAPSLWFGVCFGIGFASLEYFALSHLDVSTNGPVLGILFIHILTSVLLVYLLRTTLTRNRILTTLAILTAIHFSYNILL